MLEICAKPFSAARPRHKIVNMRHGTKVLAKGLVINPRAAIRAAQRADEPLDDGDLDGAMVWRRNTEAIDELTCARKARARKDREPLS